MLEKPALNLHNDNSSGCPPQLALSHSNHEDFSTRRRSTAYFPDQNRGARRDSIIVNNTGVEVFVRESR